MLSLAIPMEAVDVTVLGDLNIDIIVKVAGEILEDSSTITSDVTIMPGGVGANIASNITYLGLKTRVLGAVGGDVLGDYLLERLVQKGIDIGHVKIIENVSTGLMIVLVGEKGRKTIIGSRGANKYFKLEDEGIIRELVEKTRHLHVSGYASLNNDGGRTLIELLRVSKEKNRTTSIDLEGIAQYSRGFIERIRGLVDYIFLNRIEAQYLCDVREPVGCSLKTLLKVDVKAVFLKMGEQGSIVITYNDRRPMILRIEPFRISNPIDCTGAGDAYNAAVIVSLLNNRSLVEAARKGNEYGALACKRVGGFI